MKLNSRNPEHVLLAGRAMGASMCAIVGRALIPRRHVIVFLGHRLAGNLLSFYEALRDHPDCEPVFVDLDKGYVDELRGQGYRCAWLGGTEAIRVLRSAAAVVSSHGPQVLEPFMRLTRVPSIDVWHGIPYKGWHPSEFRSLRRYDRFLVSSPDLARMHAEMYGFREGQVVATGYGRVDRLVVHTRGDVQEAKAAIGLDPEVPLVLFAPTWAQDDPNRSFIPFGVSSGEFFGRLIRVVESLGARLAVRAHLNAPKEIGQTDTVLNLPFADYPDTEMVLLATDILVCDWSSIAFDFLVLDRPTIFLDVPAPFSGGFTLGPEHRFGEVVGDMEHLEFALARYLAEPSAYLEEHRDEIKMVRQVAYGGLDDGCATERYVSVLDDLLARGR